MSLEDGRKQFVLYLELCDHVAHNDRLLAQDMSIVEVTSGGILYFIAELIAAFFL